PEQIASDADKQSWAPAVESLLAFPPVVRNLASNLSWTSELGDAYFNQPADVMNAIQEMRREARKHGTLKSSDQIKVIDSSFSPLIASYWKVTIRSRRTFFRAPL